MHIEKHQPHIDCIVQTDTLSFSNIPFSFVFQTVSQPGPPRVFSILHCPEHKHDCHRLSFGKDVPMAYL